MGSQSGKDRKQLTLIKRQTQGDREWQTGTKSHGDSKPPSKVSHLAHKLETSDQGGRRGPGKDRKKQKKKQVQKVLGSQQGTGGEEKTDKEADDKGAGDEEVGVEDAGNKEAGVWET